MMERVTSKIEQTLDNRKMMKRVTKRLSWINSRTLDAFVNDQWKSREGKWWNAWLSES